MEIPISFQKLENSESKNYFRFTFISRAIQIQSTPERAQTISQLYAKTMTRIWNNFDEKNDCFRNNFFI